MARFSMPPLAPLTLDEAFEHVRDIEHTRGIAYLVPGDLHLWGPPGGNRSDLFQKLLTSLNYDKVVLLGDIFDGTRRERETTHDRQVLELLRMLDTENRLHIVRGNHDRRILQAFAYPPSEKKPIKISKMLEDMSWLTRPRLHDDIVYARTNGLTYQGQASGAPRGGDVHPGSNDILVLLVGTRHILFEHGDAHDKWARRAYKTSALERLGKCAYNLMVKLEKKNASFGGMSGTLKQKVSLWRGVCHDVSVGTLARGNELAYDIHATVAGHTHYPCHVILKGITHVNVGSFRGWRPSFVLVTRDTGEVLPPIVVRYKCD